MEFRTALQPLQKTGLVSHATPVFMLGSCFTDSVGGRLESDLFDIMRNPFGTVYNPASMDSQIRFIVSGETPVAEELIHAGGLWHSFLTHSSLSAPTQDALLENIRRSSRAALDFLQRAEVAVLTFGSAWVYRYNSTGEIVSNCHKLPAKLFTREMLSVDEAASYIGSCISTLRSVVPDMKILLTVSPIRHLADGLHGNQLSKATLLLAADRVVRTHDDVIYFPAYEAVMDDLRDYRFYEADMKHPSAVAVDYIYSLFADSFLTSGTKEAAAAARKLTRLTSHRLLSQTDEAREKFSSQVIQSAQRLVTLYPELAPAVNHVMQDWEMRNRQGSTV